MKRDINEMENEIAYQILISELCFDICNSIKIIPGRGNNLGPYYYNLNFIKGLISLDSLLLSKEKSELSISNYIKKLKKVPSKENIANFETSISSISNSFKKTFPVRLRHKVAAHIDGSFKHSDFTCAYIMPNLVPKYIKIVRQLKNTFFKFCNRAKNDYPFRKIKQQSDSMLKSVL